MKFPRAKLFICSTTKYIDKLDNHMPDWTPLNKTVNLVGYLWTQMGNNEKVYYWFFINTV